MVRIFFSFLSIVINETHYTINHFLGYFYSLYRKHPKRSIRYLSSYDVNNWFFFIGIIMHRFSSIVGLVIKTTVQLDGKQQRKSSKRKYLFAFRWFCGLNYVVHGVMYSVRSKFFFLKNLLFMLCFSTTHFELWDFVFHVGYRWSLRYFNWLKWLSDVGSISKLGNTNKTVKHVKLRMKISKFP